MNYYFLLEDEKSFIKVLPKWLGYMGFQCSRVVDIKAVTNHCYVMQSGQGVTRLIIKALYDTMDTILVNPGKINYLVIILDAEDELVNKRRREVYQKIEEYQLEKKIELEYEVRVFVCNHCFESWLLANESLYPLVEPEKESFFYPYYAHYDISKNDLEFMMVPNEREETIAKYHFHYLHDALRYRKIRYSKNKPDYVSTDTYFNAIVDRMRRTSHINSFKEFWNFIQEQNLIYTKK